MIRQIQPTRYLLRAAADQVGKLRRGLRNAGRYRRSLVPLRMWLYGRRLRRRLPAWDLILAKSATPAPAVHPARKRRVLVATSTGGHLAASSIDSVLAASLSLRGAEVEVLLCDAALPLCMITEKHILPDERRLAREGPRPLCRHCYPAAARMYQGLGVPVRLLSEFLTEADRAVARAAAAGVDQDQVRSYYFDGMAVGQQAYAGAVRFYAVGDLEREPEGAVILRRSLEAAILTAIAGRRLFSENYDAVVLHHAIYVPQGVLAAAARGAGTRIVAWNAAYRKGCFLFSHGDSYHFTLLDEDQRGWLDMPFSTAARNRISGYLASRRTGANDWIGYQRSEAPVSHANLGLDPSRPVIALMTNIIWDAQLYYGSNAFTSMRDWVIETIRWFSARPHLQLVVRIHPAEISNPLPARQRMADEIAAVWSSLPDNIVVVPPSDPMNSYALSALADSILIYGTKMGVELAAIGKPIIVAGEAWIRNKGLAYEASSAADYFGLLEQLPLSPRHDPNLGERALRYAYHFFFRCMIPIDQARPRAGWPPFEIATRKAEDLRPGKDPGLDIVCEGILEGTPFLWPAEKEDAESSEPIPVS